MTLTEIKQAVFQGKTVCWKHSGYVVKGDSLDHLLIVCLANMSAIGLTWKNGVTLNGAESDFFISEV